MKLLRTVVTICISLAILALWNKQRARTAAATAASEAAAAAVFQPDANGFVTMPRVDNPPEGKVWIIAPKNCPSQQAQRADALVGLLSGEGISSVRTNGVNIVFDDNPPSKVERDSVNRVMMAGEFPVVFVNGRAGNNPGVAAIVAEYRAATAR